MSKWQVVRSYPLEWLIVASIPLLVWASVYAFGYLMSRGGRIKTNPNVLAISGALLAYVSFLTGWGVVERGYDWMSVNDLSLFLLFTYPVAVITPLAGVGQAVVLLWVLSYRQETGGSIGPLNGYLIAWMSVMLMLASIVWPVVNGRARSAPDIYDRLLTMTIRRRSRQWMSAEHALAVLLTMIFLVIGATYLSLEKNFGAVVLLFIGLIFALFMLRKYSHEETREGGLGGQSGKVNMQCPHCGTDNPPGSGNCVGCGAVLVRSDGRAPKVGIGHDAQRAHMAWVVFLAASYIAALIAFWPIVGAFYSGYSGEERTRLLIEVLIVLIIVVPIAVFAYRRALLPVLPRELVVASVVLFASFILVASLQVSSTIRMGLSVGECLLFAGIALVGPTLFYVQARSGDKKTPGGPSSRSP